MWHFVLSQEVWWALKSHCHLIHSFVHVVHHVVHIKDRQGVSERWPCCVEPVRSALKKRKHVWFPRQKSPRRLSAFRQYLYPWIVDEVSLGVHFVRFNSQRVRQAEDSILGWSDIWPSHVAVLVEWVLELQYHIMSTRTKFHEQFRPSTNTAAEKSWAGRTVKGIHEVQSHAWASLMVGCRVPQLKNALPVLWRFDRLLCRELPELKRQNRSRPAVSQQTNLQVTRYVWLALCKCSWCAAFSCSCQCQLTTYSSPNNNDVFLRLHLEHWNLCKDEKLW